jgi:hypothetical protein
LNGLQVKPQSINPYIGKMIDFDKPKKVRTTEEHNNMFSSDSGVAGTYVPNMSIEDQKKWKGKHIKGDDERIEIRKTIGGTQLLIVVYKNTRFTDWKVNQDEWYKNHNNVRMSMNGKLDMTFKEYDEFIEVINEAKEILKVENYG